MAHCKHLDNGKCKNCTKNCPIKAKSARIAAKAARTDMEKIEVGTELCAVSPALPEALAHGARVACLAEKFFAALAPVYNFEARWADVLRTAARLHDVGWVYGQKGHHKVSARMIRAGSVEEVEKSLRIPAALVARYHRRTEPSPRQRRFAALSSIERRGVRRMAALLRLADALDFSHAGLVRDLEVTLQKNAVLLLLDCPQGCEAEIARLDAKKALFKKVFKKDVVCRCKARQESMPENLLQHTTMTEPLHTESKVAAETPAETATKATAEKVAEAIAEAFTENPEAAEEATKTIVTATSKA